MNNTTIINDTITTLSNGFACAYTNGIPLWVIFLAFIGLFAFINMIPRMAMPTIYSFAYIWGFVKWIKEMIKNEKK